MLRRLRKRIGVTDPAEERIEFSVRCGFDDSGHRIPMANIHWASGVTQQRQNPQNYPAILVERCLKDAARRVVRLLQRPSSFLSELENVAIPPPDQKTFDAEGEILEHALTKSFRVPNDAIKSSVFLPSRCRDAKIKRDCPHALQAL
jgi:hypothetical protein